MTSKEIKNQKPKKNIPWLQWIAGMGALLVLLVPGLMMGWTSPYVAQLTSKDSPIPMTLTEASWMASLLTLGRLLGAIPGVVCMNYFGGKKTLIIIGFPYIISWVCIILANSIFWLYTARLTCGIGMGMAFSSFPLYLGEISSSEIRGTLVALAINGVPLGTVIGNGIGAFVSMSVFGYISLVPTVVFILIFTWLPESPHYLIRREKIESAKSSIVRYNPEANAEAEVKSLKDFVNASNSTTFLDKLREFSIPENRKAAFIVIVLFMLMQLSGLNSVIFYLETILINGGWTITLPSRMAIVISTVGILAGLSGIYLADRCGRRTMMITSCAGVATATLALGAHFTLLNDNLNPGKLQWLMVTSLIVFHMFACTGISSVPGIVLSELFAPNIKSMAACLASISIGFFSFGSTKTYQPLVNLIGMNYLFWLYAVFMMFGMIFVLTIMPETRGKSLQEIQNMLHKKYVPVKKRDYEIY